MLNGTKGVRNMSHDFMIFSNTEEGCHEWNIDFTIRGYGCEANGIGQENKQRTMRWTELRENVAQFAYNFFSSVYAEI